VENEGGRKRGFKSIIKEERTGVLVKMNLGGQRKLNRATGERTGKPKGGRKDREK